MRADNYFVQIPDWITDAHISDGAYRLYGVLQTYASREKHTCHPARSTLAERLGKGLRTVDGYLRELEDAGAIRVTHRKSESSPREWTSNEYMLITTPPLQNPAPPSAENCTTPPAAHCATLVQNPAHKQEPLNKNQLNNNSPSPPVTKAGARTTPYTQEFLTWWAHYPRKQDKGGAFKAWQKIKDATLDELIAGADRYANDPNRIDQYTKHPATWLNARSWEDETPLPARNTSHRQLNNNERMAAAMKQANRGRAALSALTGTPDRREIE